jgi:hypothetical protein
MGGKSLCPRPTETVRQTRAHTREMEGGGIEPQKKIMKIAELIPDKRNANKGTKRGADAVAKSLRDYGAGRSVLVDRNGNVLAGNQTVKAASAAGIDQDVIIVETDGSQLVVVQRTDLDRDDPKARALAIADNRAAELGLEWDPANLAELSTGLDLQPFFSTAELAEIIAPDPGAPGAETLEGRYKQQYGVICICKDEADQRKVYEQLTGQGLECRVVVT